MTTSTFSQQINLGLRRQHPPNHRTTDEEQATKMVMVMYETAVCGFATCTVPNPSELAYLPDKARPV